MDDNELKKYEKMERELNDALDDKNTTTYSVFKKFIPLFVSAINIDPDKHRELSLEFIYMFDQYRPIVIKDDTKTNILLILPQQRNNTKTINEVSTENPTIHANVLNQFFHVNQRGNVNVLSAAPELVRDRVLEFAQHMVVTDSATLKEYDLSVNQLAQSLNALASVDDIDNTTNITDIGTSDTTNFIFE